MKSLNVTFTAQNTETKETLTTEIDVTSYTSESEVLEQLLEDNDIEEDTENWELLDEITSDEDIHKNYLNLEDIFEYAEAYNECSYDLDVFNAGIECGVNLSDIDESYNGEFGSDEDFARETAESIGAINKYANWPNNCIDWKYAAKELMYDYSESNGHYFRNL